MATFPWNPATRQCTAKSKRSGVQCKRRASIGREVCKMHGGATPRGVEHPRHRGRGYSKDLPTRLYDRYQQALDDPKLTSMKNELALIDTRLSDLFQSGVQARREWNEVYELIDLRRKVAGVEHKRLKALGEFVSRQQLLAFMGVLQRILLEEIPDAEMRRRIAARITVAGHADPTAEEPVAVIGPSRS